MCGTRHLDSQGSSEGVEDAEPEVVEDLEKRREQWELWNGTDLVIETEADEEGPENEETEDRQNEQETTGSRQGWPLEIQHCYARNVCGIACCVTSLSREWNCEIRVPNNDRTNNLETIYSLRFFKAKSALLHFSLFAVFASHFLFVS